MFVFSRCALLVIPPSESVGATYDALMTGLTLIF